jgi:hypothetical protein
MLTLLDRERRRGESPSQSAVPPARDPPEPARSREQLRKRRPTALTDEELIVNLARMFCEEKIDAD